MIARTCLVGSRVVMLALLFCASALRAEDAAKETPKDSAAQPKSVVPAEKDRNRHDQFMKRIQEGKVGLLFLGDSITDGWRNEQQKKTFDEHYGKYDAANFGIGGDQTQHVLWRIRHGELEGIDPKVTVMMIGTNNLGNKQSVDDTVAGIKVLVDDIKQKLPHTKILLLGVFPRGAKPDDHFRAEIKAVNEQIAKLDDGGKTVKYLDIGDKFLDAEGNLTKDIMPDALHPNAKGYEIWADAMEPTLDELMKS